jgi:alkaline phosphatase
MLRLGCFVALSALLCSSGALAQGSVPQTDSQWYTDAQAKIQEMLARQPITGQAKNVILFIADGNGIATNYATRIYAGQQMEKLGEEHLQPHEMFPYLALVKTYNVNAQTPDSAPTASAMNTGVKSNFTTINVSENSVAGDCSTYDGNALGLFAEVATESGRSVGFVTTARVTHATPAAVYAKTVHRDWEGEVPEGCTAQKDIAAQLVDAMQSGMVDLAMGGGRRFFYPDGFVADEETKGRRTDGRNLVEELTGSGVQYAWNTETASALNLDGSTPVLALFEDSHMKYDFDRTDEDEPSLADMTRMAIEHLSKNSTGYYLEVEAGRVDHANHDGNLHRTVTDGVAFDEAIALADELTNDGDTLIIVTADHSHALIFNGYCGRGTPITGLCYEVDDHNVAHSDKLALASDGKPYTVAGFLNGAGSVLIKQSDGSYFGTRAALDQETATDPDFLQQALVPMDSETHSGEDVAVYAKGPWAHLFDGTVEQNYIFHVMNEAISAQ